MKLYLAHPLVMRHEIRKIELGIEERTGIELLNPFYDQPRPEIEAMDRGEARRDDPNLDYLKIVTDDLDLVDAGKDGILAYYTRKVHQIGTVCESWYALNTGLPVYVVSEDCLGHPWIRYMVECSKGHSFPSWEEFEKYIVSVCYPSATGYVRPPSSRPS